jgi:predicted amidohydrolase
MKHYHKIIMTCVVAFAFLASVPGQSSKNLVANPGFEFADPGKELPQGWQTTFPRVEIAPEFRIDNSVSRTGKNSVKISSSGSKGTYGSLLTTVKGIVSDLIDFKRVNTVSRSEFLGSKSYMVGCYYKTSGIEFPEKNIRMKISWLDKTGNELFTEFISTQSEEKGWYHIAELKNAPFNAAALRLNLILQWEESGTVWWDDVHVEEAPAQSLRMVKVAAASNWPGHPSTTEKNLQFYADKISEAGKLGADLLCLGEGITMVSTGKSFEETAETVPGPTSRILGEAARKANMYVVAGIYEHEASLIYNTAILIDRQGNVAGKYRKTHLPQTEVEGGLTPCDTYPVFNTDFGKIGIEICYDNFYPEVARSLMLNGAEIVLCPIWGDIRGLNYEWDIVARARAIDNSVFFVASMYEPKGSLIIDPDGKILAAADGNSGLIISEIDLNMRTFERWLSVKSYGEWKNLFPKERRSETYKDLTR